MKRNSSYDGHKEDPQENNGDIILIFYLEGYDEYAEYFKNRIYAGPLDIF